MKQLAADERAEFAAFLETLTPEQWDAPTLCDEWRVRDVVAHVVSYDDLSLGAAFARVARAGFSLRRANHARLAELANLSTAEILAMVRRNLVPSGLTAVAGARIALTDGLIHHQDIRRPLGLPREIPPERLRRALTFAMTAPPLAVAPRVRGLRLVATDLDWTHGTGQEVTGPAEALLMAATGRRVAGELSGPGQPTLAARIDS
jgi:uncharacterized protein (TIGR03083 family)